MLQVVRPGDGGAPDPSEAIAVIKSCGLKDPDQVGTGLVGYIAFDNIYGWCGAEIELNGFCTGCQGRDETKEEACYDYFRHIIKILGLK